MSPFSFQPTKHQKHMQFPCNFCAILTGGVRYFLFRSALRTFGKTHIFCVALRSVHTSCSLFFGFIFAVLPPRLFLFLPLAAHYYPIIPPISPVLRLFSKLFLCLFPFFKFCVPTLHSPSRDRVLSSRHNLVAFSRYFL